MLVPANYTEQEVIDIINEALNKLAKKFRFGYHEVEDIKQEGFLIAMEGLSRYDGKRPLPNYIYIHIKNRLINFKRDNYERLEKPCDKCPLKAYIKIGNICTAYDNKLDCKPFYNYQKRNSQKKQLMHAENVEYDITESHRGIGEGDNDSRQKEMEDYINVNLPVEYRGEYLRIKFGHKINQQRREFIENVLLEILEKGGYI